MADPNPNPNPNPIYRGPLLIDISDEEEEEEIQMDDGSDLPVPGEEENNDAGEDEFEHDFTESDEEEDNEDVVEEGEDSMDPDYESFLARLSAQNSAGVAAGAQPTVSDEEEDNEDGVEEDNEDGVEEEGDSIDPDYESFLARLTAQNSVGVAAGAQPSAAAEGGGGKRRRSGEPGTSASAEIGEGSRGGVWNGSEMDGLFCSICLEAWTNGGDHSICCLPCGHLFGMSCIMKWLVRRDGGKCPQCNRKCKVKDIRRLFVSSVSSVDEESQKRIRALEEKCALLEKEVAGYRKKEAEWTKKLRRVLRHVKVGTPLEDIPVHDLEASSSEDYESAIRLLVEELVAEKACQKAEAELHAEVAAEMQARRCSQERLASWQQSWVQYWDQVMHRLNARFPDLDIPPLPDFRSFASVPPETQPNHHAGANEGRTSSD